ncbi:aspartyl protease family protein At5g10770-like [Malania oleifera]|uniref:aspartyl protease family protein At5g10770-like n=1 Tax=Malania oleifera TaxID=397392 RepID=UPI0025AE83BF|nr:aspartyl protease family protein At5g10770-like [Malania oleifera]
MGIVEYVVTVALGTPEKKVTFVMDTGSDFSWIQCLPCQWSCYEQMEPIFNPSKSSSYTNISCNSSLCKLSDDFGCYQETSTCSYSISYGDGSRTVGFVSEDKLTLTNSNVISKFLFGCGQNNTGILLGTAGILGLGLSKTSVMSQITPKYEKAFSYCLPSSLCFTGHLTLGNDSLIGRNTSSIQFTPLFYSNDLPYYFADLIAMSVGGKKLPVDESVFTRPGTIIDSGTVLSRIPPTAYVALQSAFQYQMAKYPRTCQIEGLDPCYDLSNNTYVMIPKISLFFRGNVELDIDASGTLLGFNESCICLAFMGNRDPTYVSIILNFQLKTYDVIHDIEGKKVGFGKGGCL